MTSRVADRVIAVDHVEHVDATGHAVVDGGRSRS